MLKTIGLIGGMSWESTAHYYSSLNQGVQQALGGLHSAKIILHSLDFASIAQLQTQGDWDTMGDILADAGKKLETGGADIVLICTNTMHKLADRIQQDIKIPLLHIADATARALVKDNIKSLGLLGTAYTMEQDFYKMRLIKDYGLEVIIPEESDRKLVHDIIYDELCLGQVKQDSRKIYQKIVLKLVEQGAQAVILGCTEIGMLLRQTDTDIPLYDTTQIHARSAVEWACCP